MIQAQRDKWAKSQKVSEPKPAKELTDDEIAKAISIDGVSLATPLREIALLQARAIIAAHERKKAKPTRTLQCRWAKNIKFENNYVCAENLKDDRFANDSNYKWISDIITTPVTD